MWTCSLLPVRTSCQVPQSDPAALLLQPERQILHYPPSTQSAQLQYERQGILELAQDAAS
jgi:hypothetical protein